MVTEDKQLGQITVGQAMSYVLSAYGPMSHLKVQKLLYYLQAYHLAYFEKPLMNAQFEAWVHGPVCRAVFDTLKDKSLLYSDVVYEPTIGEIEPKAALVESLASSQMELVEDVLQMFGSWKGTELEALSHEEQPWLEARGGLDASAKCSNIIQEATMMAYYKQFLN